MNSSFFRVSSDVVYSVQTRVINGKAARQSQLQERGRRAPGRGLRLRKEGNPRESANRGGSTNRGEPANRMLDSCCGKRRSNASVPLVYRTRTRSLATPQSMQGQSFQGMALTGRFGRIPRFRERARWRAGGREAAVEALACRFLGKALEERSQLFQGSGHVERFGWILWFRERARWRDSIRGTVTEALTCRFHGYAFDRQARRFQGMARTSRFGRIPRFLEKPGWRAGGSEAATGALACRFHKRALKRASAAFSSNGLHRSIWPRVAGP